MDQIEVAATTSASAYSRTRSARRANVRRIAAGWCSTKTDKAFPSMDRATHGAVATDDPTRSVVVASSPGSLNSCPGSITSRTVSSPSGPGIDILPWPLIRTHRCVDGSRTR